MCTALRADQADWSGWVEKGRLLRFDAVRGYGFIAPEQGGEDVFLHASALHDDAERARPGMIVEFEAIAGEHGRKAVAARILHDAASPWAYEPRPRTTGRSRPASTSDEDVDGELCEVVTEAEFGREVTDILISAVPAMTAAQIVQVRQRLAAYAQARGWLED